MIFILQHAAVLLLLLAVSAAAGTLMMGTRVPLPLRAALGMAAAGQIFIVLGTIGVLRPWSLGAFAVVALAGGAARMGKIAMRWQACAATLLTLPLFLLALYPPIAFDETLYHLPFVRSMAGSGTIRFLSDVRFPAFPQLHEALCVPAFLLVGDTATHLVALAEVVILGGLMIAWPRQWPAGLLAAALVLGNPIVAQVASVTYVEAAMMLFVAAGFFCLDRNVPAAGFLLGTACSVKYLGCYFAAAAFVYLCLFGAHRRRTIPLFLAALVAGVLPMYGRVVALTGQPFFPFLSKIFGSSAWLMAMPPAPGSRIVNALRLFWDITFARERVNVQPPYSPLFAVAMLITFAAAARQRRLAFLAAVSVGYVAIFTFLPQDSRYLLPLLPLVSIAAARVAAPLLRKNVAIAVALVAVSPGLAYAGYRLARLGPVPVNAVQRQAFLEARIPEYRALEHRGPGRIYVCGAEQLKYYGGDELFGDVVGPFANATVFPGSAGGRPALPGFHYLLISRAHCPEEWQRLPSERRFPLLYQDDAAALWRVRP